MPGFPSRGSRTTNAVRRPFQSESPSSPPGRRRIDNYCPHNHCHWNRQPNGRNRNATSPQGNLPGPSLPLLLRQRSDCQKREVRPEGASSQSRTHIIREATASCDRTRRYASSSTGRSPNRIGGALSATPSSRITTTSSPTISARRAMGGAWRDDHPDDVQAVHWWCNGEKGSRHL